MEAGQLLTALPGYRRAGLKINHELCTIWGEEYKNLLSAPSEDESMTSEKPRASFHEAGHGEEGTGMESVIPLSEYPRPQLVRKTFEGQHQILNGIWSYAIVGNRRLPESFEGKILVPFSPETMLSGVERQLKPDEFIWYEKHFSLKLRKDMRLLLHFGAVDQVCEVYLNGKRIARHKGGFLPFDAEITAVVKEGDNTLRVCAQDVTDRSYRSRGKQKLNNGGMFYTAQSGIWQTVWYEWVPMTYIETLRITPLYDESRVDVKVTLNGENKEKQKGAPVARKESFQVKAYEPMNGLLVDSRDAGDFCDHRKSCRSILLEAETLSLDASHVECHFRFEIPDMKSWTPEEPYIYGIVLAVGEDSVQTYTAMRRVSVETLENGRPVICLNHKSCFMDGVLDQGYYPESLMTPPSEEAMLHDILTIKGLGFNMLRKHCKIEPDRWYFHCDRLGMLVWQDMVNGGTAYNMLSLCYLPTLFPRLFWRRKDTTKRLFKKTGRISQAGRRMWEKETMETIRLLYNHPSIVCWVIFNEGWGQFDSEKGVELAKSIDAERLIDAASGWFDQGAGDIKSEHNYFRRLEVHGDGKRAFVLSEYGGYAYGVSGHTYSDKLYGYGVYKNREAFCEAFKVLREKIRMLKDEGLSAAVYTQVSDIEEEINGIMTYDRKYLKTGTGKN